MCDTGWPNEIPVLVQSCLLMTQGLGYCVGLLVVWYGKSTLAFGRVA